nr:GH3 auxin-responsive promoter family protein [Maliibacterium massiliense]
MRFEQKLKHMDHDKIWSEYCGFLDLDMDGYMRIQNRLMQEQMRLWSRSAIGRKILGEKTPQSIEEFRQMVPLTTYDDYADVLLQKRGDMLPDIPIVWIQTTWEGGRHPIKVAPYTQGMLEVFRNNIITCVLLSTSTRRGQFNVRPSDKILYALAPLPYLTGLFPLALEDEIGMEFLPPVKESVKLSFSERNKKGFKLGMQKGIEFFFGVGSVAYFVSTSLSKMAQAGGSGKLHMSISALRRMLVGKYRSKQENRPLKPRDVFKLKGFMCAGTDNWCYKDDLQDLWGVRPMELFAGTEFSLVGTETWTRNGMYFFPDTCFYEFIPEDEMNASLDNPAYQPRTCLMNEVQPGEKYELAVTVFKGGAFARYRAGDVYRCVGTQNSDDGTNIPRFQYIDRIPTVIDIAGFTRITQYSIQSAVNLSGLPIAHWVAAKAYTENKRPYMHMYVELDTDAMVSSAVSREVLKEHLSVYFKYMDQDYKDLKGLLGIDPLEVTILKCGTFEEYTRQSGETLRPVNPAPHQLRRLIALQQQEYLVSRGRGV